MFLRYPKTSGKVENAGLEVNFSVHSHSLAGKIFSTSKLVRPLANYFQMFGRHG